MNLAFFMVNLSRRLMRDRRDTDPNRSVLDHKTHYRGLSYGVSIGSPLTGSLDNWRRYWYLGQGFQVPGVRFQVERIRKPCVSQDYRVAWNLGL